MLNLSSSDISDIDETVMETIMQHVKDLDIRGNNLKEIPETVATSNKTNKLWLSDNPYECNCDMLWMKDWLIDTENVVDKNDVKCMGSKEKGNLKRMHSSSMCTVRFGTLPVGCVPPALVPATRKLVSTLPPPRERPPSGGTPSPSGQADTYENITFPQLRLQTVISIR